jgi:glucose-1-phosphate thymidylyltransferase
MKALLLAAGYGTRLHPLTVDRPKTLLPVADRPILDWIADKVDEVTDVDELHVVTNARFAATLEDWAKHRVGRLTPVVHDDGTTTNENRLGAIGDIAFVVDREGWERDDLLVIAGDNLFDFSLADYVAFWRARDEDAASAIALYEHPRRDLLSNYGIVEVDPEGRVKNFLEKPDKPPSNLVATATYIYDRAHVALLHAYLAEGNSPDAPGNFIAWLHKRAPVYGYRFQGEWLDIGDHSQLLEADNRLRARAGLAQRAAYQLED